MKRPIIWTSHTNEFHFLWIWRICLSWSFEVKDTKSFIEVWNAKRSIMFAIGNFGIGLGHSFGLPY